MSYPWKPPLGRSDTYADNGPADSRYPSLAETSNSRKPPLGRSSTVVAESWYPPSPLAAPSSPPGPLRHASTWPLDSLSTSRPSPSTCLPVGRLLVKVFKAREIKGGECLGRGKADPYAKIKLGGRDLGREEKTSAHKDAGSNPVWNEHFTFYVQDHHIEYNQLKISLYNKNKFLDPRKDNFLGYLHILNMGEFMWGRNTVLERWYPVYLGDEEKGQIMLGFDMIPMSEQDMLRSNAIHDLPETLRPAHSRETDGYQIPPYSKVINIALEGASLALAVATVF